MNPPHLDYLWQYLPYWAEVDPDFPTLHFAGETITAGQLNQRVTRLAQALLAAGVGRGDSVLTILPCVPEYIYTFCAAGMIGALTVPMDVRYRPADYRRLVPHADPKVVVSVAAVDGYDVAGMLAELSSEWSPAIRYWLTEPATFGTPFGDALAYAGDRRAALAAAQAALDPDQGNLVVFTGGSTGVPKAALLSHRNVTEMAYVERAALAGFLAAEGVTGRFKTFANLPPSHVGGTVEVIGCGLLGGWEIFMQAYWSPTAYLQLTQDERLPWMGAVPTMYSIMLSLPELGNYDLSSVRIAFMSGEKVGTELLDGVARHFSPNIVNGYGSTEAGAEVTFTAPGDDHQALADGYVGRPLPGAELRIVDLDGNPLPPGETGEVLVRGPLTIRSYFRMPAEDRVGFTPDGWCRTGDLGYLTADGGLYVKGRLKQIIRVGSYTVLPTEVEEVVVTLPGVAQAVVIAVPDATYGEAIWLLAVPEPGAALDEAAILAHCRAQLANYKVPRRVFLRDALPTTHIGKVDRVRLRDALLAELGE